MTNPYSDDRQSENPFAYYEEDASLPVQDYDAEPTSKMEPRTPFSMTLRRIRAFQWSAYHYRLIVLQDHCELVLNDQPKGFVMRNDASDCVRIKGKKITITDRSGRKYRFIHEWDVYGDILRARLAFWAQGESDLDPVAAYCAVRDLLAKNLFRWLFHYWLNLIVIFAFALAMFGSASYADRSEGNAIFVILLFYLLFYPAVGVLLHWKRKLAFSRKIFFLTLFPVIVIAASFPFAAGFMAAVLGSIPAFWIFFTIFVLRTSLRQLRIDNAELFVKTDENVPS